MQEQDRGAQGAQIDQSRKRLRVASTILMISVTIGIGDVVANEASCQGCGSPPPPPPQKMDAAAVDDATPIDARAPIDAPTLPPGSGGIEFTIEATGVASNCGPGGSGITGMEIIVQRGMGGCEAGTLTEIRGGIPVGAYVVNCSSPAVSPCIERDTTLAMATDVGELTISVAGKVNASTCWMTDVNVTIPSGTAVNLGPIALSPTGMIGCPR